MKKILNLILAGIILSISVTACKGTNTDHPGDTIKTDSTVMDSSASGKAAGANGSAATVDSGMDKSGSGGVDTTKK